MLESAKEYGDLLLVSAPVSIAASARRARFSARVIQVDVNSVSIHRVHASLGGAMKYNKEGLLLDM